MNPVLNNIIAGSYFYYHYSGTLLLIHYIRPYRLSIGFTLLITSLLARDTLAQAYAVLVIGCTPTYQCYSSRSPSIHTPLHTLCFCFFVFILFLKNKGGYEIVVKSYICYSYLLLSIYITTLRYYSGSGIYSV